MEFKKNLVFTLLDKMLASMTSLDYVESQGKDEVELLISVDTKKARKDNAYKSQLRTKLNSIKKMKLEMTSIHITGGLGEWDIVLMFKVASGNCVSVEMTMTTSCTITFVHSVDENLQQAQSAHHIYEAMETLFRIKESMLAISGMDHKDYIVPSVTTPNSSPTKSADSESNSQAPPPGSAGNPIKIPMEYKPNKTLRMKELGGLSPCGNEIDQCILEVSALNNAVTGLKNLVNASTSSLILRMTSACINGSREMKSPISEIKDHMEG